MPLVRVPLLLTPFQPLAMKPPPSSAEPAKDSPPSPAPVLGERSKSIVMDPRRRGSITSGAGGVAPVPSRSPGSSPGKRHLAAPEPGTLLGASSSSSSLSQPEGMQRSSLSPKDGHRASVPERPSIVYDSSDEDDASAAPAKGMGRRFSDTPSHPQHVSNTNTGISHARSTTTLSTLALPQSGPHPTPGLAVTPRRRGPDGFAPVIKIADADTQVVTTRLSPTRSDDRTVPFYTEYTEEEEEWTREREREREKERERAREREKEREFARLAEAQGSDRPSLAGLKSVKSSSDIKELKRSLMSDPNSDPLAAGPRPQTSRQTLGALPLGKLPSHNNLAALAEGNTTLAPLSSATKKPLAPLKLDALPLPSAGGLAAGPLSPTPLPPPPTSSSQVPPSSSPQSPRGSPLAEERVDPLPPPLQGRRPSLTGGSGPLPLPGLKRPGVL